ncbi:hypothetical protein [Paraburkholderia rhizosphaerae]|uniref:Uncharacterized protein n=1 Tax=Paraburkholderia rhizosphaerae TaxID=480658 RepID=A0A4V3HEG3_9BURK|nr:hypothetical protein [Paraburkholderia rhizosphaerae]TDY46558.1 hypothetical protein BX592_113187 [Paraburkholderia rhizosphaerae]
METKSLLPQQLSRDISQLGIALKDCARQLRYAARNVPGPLRGEGPRTSHTAHPAPARLASPLSSLPPLSLESVAHLADDLLESAESLAGHAVPPLQDHWKSPVPLASLTTYLGASSSDTKAQRKFSMSYYAAAKRMIMQCGATDVLIFEHRVSHALDHARAALASARERSIQSSFAGGTTAASALARPCAQLAASLIDLQPIRSTRFDTLPDVSAPWWLVTEPNAYVFLMLTVASLCKEACPNGIVTEPDAVLRFFADVIGARETALRTALKERDRIGALADEIGHIVSHLC